MDPITPGEILREEYMEPLGLSQNALGRALGVSPRAINEIVHGKRNVTAAMSIRLGAYFKQSPRFWLNIQNECDVRKVMNENPGLARDIHPIEFVAEDQDSYSS